MDIKQQIANIQRSAQTDPRFKNSGEVRVTPEAKEFTNRLFKSLLPHFPAWRQSCQTDEDLGRLKNAWTKAIMRHELKTGEKLNIRAGLVACEESETDWLVSVGKFISMCNQSNDIMPLAQRALDLFNSGQKQIDTVGKMVTGKHGFDLKAMKSADTNKRFIELYLSYAQNNAIESLESFALTETVTLSPEQQKDAEKRANKARNSFLKQFNGLIDSEPVKVDVKVANCGIVTKKQHSHKSQKEIDESRERQLAMIKGKLK